MTMRGLGESFEARGRLAADRDNDPEMLVGPDLIHYTELLIREEHKVLAPHFQFWGGLADHLNRVMHLPGRSDYSRRVSEFNAAVAMCYGYLRMSTASQVVRLDLLRRYFPPPAEITEQGDDDDE